MVKQKNLKTEVIAVDPSCPETALIDRAAAVIRAGGLVSFPTETVYGLGANALDTEAVARIFEAKGRPSGNPLIVHVTGVGQARDLAELWPDVADALANAFWPGPLTLVVKKKPTVPDIVTAGGQTVALRSPAHPVAAALIEAAGVPIAAPSANRSTRISPTTAQHVLKGLSGQIHIVLDGGPTSGGIESTVLDVTREPAALLRLGLVPREQIEKLIGPIAAQFESAVPGPARSPGTMERHYAPLARLEVCSSSKRRAKELANTGRKVGWIAFECDQTMPTAVHQLALPSESSAYSAGIYAALHELDDAGVEAIIVESVPETDEWAAVRDRLRRAAAKTG